MCGIAGIWSENLSSEKLKDSLARMSEALLHRGPDSSGVYIDTRCQGLALAHRRLAILDLSAAGHQPMISATGRYVIVLNGEIYNFKELGQELAALGAVFRGGSDTEVVLAAIEQWGLEVSLHKFLGMFAFAILDRDNQQLILARDRFGVKPLYYGQYKSGIAFASEVRGFEALPEFSKSINREAVDSLRLHLCTVGRQSIYESINKLLPGHYLTITRENLSATPVPICYWDPIASAKEASCRPKYNDYSEAKTVLNNLLISAVKYRMVSDVPIGCFLSGGVDSSMVAAIMQSQSTTPINTFTIGFDEKEFNEAPFAEAIAKHLGTNHTTTVLSLTDALSIIPKMGQMYDEPFADSSQIATFLVSQQARKHVTVALSGDGGDEFFGGYNRYVFSKLWRARIAKIPRPVKKMLAYLLSGQGPNRLGNLMEMTGYRRQNLRNKLEKMGKIIGAESNYDFYKNLTSANFGGERGDKEFENQVRRSFHAEAGFDEVTSMMLADISWYLPDDILVKVDRASMAVGLEAREPLLDHRLFELSQRLPMAMKISPELGGKAILKDILGTYIPKAMFLRPKDGFALPMAAWLRGGLCEWVSDLLTVKQLNDVGIHDHDYILRLWSLHKSGEIDSQDKLWPVLSLLSWSQSR